VVGSDFAGISSEGKFINGAGLISQEIESDKNSYTSTRNEKLNVRVFGLALAAVNGMTREKGTGTRYKPFDLSGSR
jgi:hypothetical protein